MLDHTAKSTKKSKIDFMFLKILFKDNFERLNTNFDIYVIFTRQQHLPINDKMQLQIIKKKFQILSFMHQLLSNIKITLYYNITI